MKCHQCGADLQDNALFCRECGAKQDKREARFCRECGTKIAPGVKFCHNCGAKILQQSSYGKQSVNYTQVYESTVGTTTKNSLESKSARKNKTGKKNPYVWTIIIVTLITAISLTWLQTKQKANNSVGAGSSLVPIIQENEHSITKGKQYAYMSDEWNVYVAVAISDSIVKIEHWDKTLSSSFSVKYKEDLGTYQISDASTGFGWLDEGHTAFILSFRDKENSRVRKEAARVFTLCVNDSKKNKGTAYDKRIRCFTYGCDDWHKYRAVPLNDHLIKMECWYRSMAFGDYGFGWTWCVIDSNNNDQGFQWTDDEHT